MTMANRIKERRIAMHLTQDALAQKLGLQKSAIAKYENGRVQNIKKSILAKMSLILECTPSYLMGFDDLSPDIILSPAERELVIAYRNANSGIRTSIRKLLDIEESATERRSSTSADIETA